MKSGMMCRVVIALGLVMQSAPIAWAQLADIDPALNAAVDALVAHDPVVASDRELAQLCREIAEATLVDPRERAAVTNEVVVIQREGVDLATVISPEVREAAREQWTAVQGQMREQLETLRATDPEKAKEMELMMREGERQMETFAAGEHYTPSPEMVEHAKEMFGEWKESMLEQGATPEMVARAETEFARWSSGEMEMGMMGGPGNMPSSEQMEAMVAAGQMTPEQFQMAQEHMQQGGMMPEGMPMPEGMMPHDMLGPGMEMPEGFQMPEGFDMPDMPQGFEIPEGMQGYEGPQLPEGTWEPPENNWTPPERPEYVPPPGSPGSEPSPTPEGPHTLVIDNPDPNLPDQWDGNDTDSVEDHAHPNGTAPHSGP